MSNECIDATNLAQQTTSESSRYLIVVDSASACHIFSYGDLVDIITSYSDGGIGFPLMIRSNGGNMQCDVVCTYDNLKETVRFDCCSIANILYMALLVKEQQVYFDSAVEIAFSVFKEDGTMMRFTEQGQRIFVHNIEHNNDMLHNHPNTYDSIVYDIVVEF